MYGRSAGGRSQNGSTARSAGGGSTAAVTMMAAITQNSRAGMVAPLKNYQTTASGGGGAASTGGAMLEGEWSSLDPNLYQNMSNDQVDWAALAQQWIQMKETLPADMVPAAPPPPIISENYVSNSRESFSDGMRLGTIDEQGEAPMEVERDEDPSSMGHQQQNSAWDEGTASWQYAAHPEWRNSAWESSWSSGSVQSNKASTVPAYETRPVAVNPTASIAIANWQAKMARIYKLGDSNNPGAIAGTVQPTNQKSQQKHHDVPKRIPSLMDQVIKLDQDHGDQGELDEDTTQTINDAKRKLLPAWIREGLEKMEREKVRQVEKEKEQLQREEMMEQRRQAELEALTELEDAKKRSKFESESEEEEAEDDDSKQEDSLNREASPVPLRSRDEILQELMVAVRKNLTEILLEVTNEEIAHLAKETLTKTRRKAPTAQTLRKTGLAAITGGLGLGIYGDSDEEDESGSDNDRDDDGNSEDDEETERSLKIAIKQRQKEFEWTAREIEDQLAQEEAREERKRREYEQNVSQKPEQQNNDSDEDDYGAGSSRSGLGHSQQLSGAASATGSVHGGKFGPRDGETQPVNDKIYAYKLGRARDKRISRFSDPKDTVRQTHITHVAIVNHNPGEVVQPMSMPRVNQPAQLAGSSGISPPVVNPAAVPLFPAAMAAAMHLENYRRGNSVASETPSNASSSRVSSSHRSGRDGKSSHKSHKSKKHKRSRYSRSDEEDEYNDNDREDDRYSQQSRRSHSSERSSRRRRSYSRDSRDDERDRKYSYKSRDRSRSRSRDRYRSSRRSRSRSRSSSKRRY